MKRYSIVASLAAFELLLACGSQGGSGDGGSTGASSVGEASNGTPTSGPTSSAEGGGATGQGGTATSEGVDESGGGDTGTPACPYEPVSGAPAVGLELVAEGFDAPVLAVGHPTQPDRVFVVEREGRIKIVEPGQTQAPEESFLEIDVNRQHSEQGLLSFAFHPNYPEDRRIYVAYSATGFDSDPPTVVAEYAVNEDETVNYDSARIVIAAGSPAGNHNGGMIAFGPDGYLYFGTGDGGGGGNHYQTARDTGSVLAKILRIGVEPDGTPDAVRSCNACEEVGSFDYTIPPDNPFVGEEGYAPEAYALGMRNPWRFSFDPEDGTLYVADVGQDDYEEISVVEGGGDYGWHAMEGNHCFAPPENQCDETAGPNGINAYGLTAPIAEYVHTNGRCSVTGLGAYRGCEVPGWDGVYFYGDFCTGELFALRWDGSQVEDLGMVLQLPGNDAPIGGGGNAFGDVFITLVNLDPMTKELSDGRVYRIAPPKD